MSFHPPEGSPLLDHCPETLPAWAYTDPEWFAREERLIWARNWVYASRVDAQEKGTMRRVRIAGDEVIVLRDGAGDYSAFHNVCRHRGAELCRAAVEPWNGKLIKCPYHAWAYDAGGALRSTGFATPTDDFDRAAHGLHKVHLKLWNGCVFLGVADDAPAFSPDIGADALDNWPMETLMTGHVLETELACNWKIFWENYNECLHCPGIHPGLSDLVPVYRRGIMAEAEDPDGPGEGAALRDGARSWTVTGAPCGPEFPDLTDDERAIAHTFVTLYPTMYIVAHVDYVRTVSLTPLGPERTGLRAEWLFAPETLAQPGFDAAEVTGFAETVIAEDGAACEMNQRGLRSSRYETGRLMPQEFEIHAFHKWVMAQLDA